MLTQSEQRKVLLYLNKIDPDIYSIDNLTPGSRWYSRYVYEQLTQDIDEIDKEIQDKLSNLEAIDQQLTSSRTRFKVTSLGQGELNINRNEVNQLKSERYRYIREMADLLRLPLNTR